MIVRPSELSHFCPSPSARKSGMAARFVRGVQVVHVVIEFIETGSDGGHSLLARAKIRSAAPAGHLGHPGPLLVLSRVYGAADWSLRGRISDKRIGHPSARHRDAVPHHTIAPLHPHRHRHRRSLATPDRHSYRTPISFRFSPDALTRCHLNHLYQRKYTTRQRRMKCRY